MNVQFMKLLMDKISFPEEAKEFFADLYNSVKSSYEEEFDSFIGAYDEIDKNGFSKKLQAFAEKAGGSYYSYWMLLLLLVSEEAKKKYEERGVSDEVFFDTFSDLTCKLIECKNVKGVWGTFVHGWYVHFLSCNIIKFGRLEYASGMYARGVPFVVGDVSIPDCSPMYYIHIPSSGEPFTLEERLKSYKMAYDFFTRETGSEYLMCECGSWLLYPEYQKVFPEGSNSGDFYKDFTLHSVTDFPDFDDDWRVFGNTDGKKIDDYPEDTRMRRAFKKHLLNGGKNGYGEGILVYDGEKLLTRKD